MPLTVKFRERAPLLIRQAQIKAFATIKAHLNHRRRLKRTKRTGRFLQPDKQQVPYLVDLEPLTQTPQNNTIETTISNETVPNTKTLNKDEETEEDSSEEVHSLLTYKDPLKFTKGINTKGKLVGTYSRLIKVYEAVATNKHRTLQPRSSLLQLTQRRSRTNNGLLAQNMHTLQPQCKSSEEEPREGNGGGPSTKTSQEPCPAPWVQPTSDYRKKNATLKRTAKTGHGTLFGRLKTNVGVIERAEDQAQTVKTKNATPTQLNADKRASQTDQQKNGSLREPTKSIEEAQRSYREREFTRLWMVYHNDPVAYRIKKLPHFEEEELMVELRKILLTLNDEIYLLRKETNNNLRRWVFAHNVNVTDSHHPKPTRLALNAGQGQISITNRHFKDDWSIVQDKTKILPCPHNELIPTPLPSKPIEPFTFYDRCLTPEQKKTLDEKHKNNKRYERLKREWTCMGLDMVKRGIVEMLYEYTKGQQVYKANLHVAAAEKRKLARIHATSMTYGGLREYSSSKANWPVYVPRAELAPQKYLSEWALSKLSQTNASESTNKRTKHWLSVEQLTKINKKNQTNAYRMSDNEDSSTTTDKYQKLTKTATWGTYGYHNENQRLEDLNTNKGLIPRRVKRKSITGEDSLKVYQPISSAIDYKLRAYRFKNRSTHRTKSLKARDKKLDDGKREKNVTPNYKWGDRQYNLMEGLATINGMAETNKARLRWYKKTEQSQKIMLLERQQRAHAYRPNLTKKNQSESVNLQAKEQATQPQWDGNTTGLTSGEIRSRILRYSYEVDGWGNIIGPGRIRYDTCWNELDLDGNITRTYSEEGLTEDYYTDTDPAEDPYTTRPLDTARTKRQNLGGLGKEPTFDAMLTSWNFETKQASSENKTFEFYQNGVYDMLQGPTNVQELRTDLMCGTLAERAVRWTNAYAPALLLQQQMKYLYSLTNAPGYSKVLKIHQGLQTTTTQSEVELPTVEDDYLEVDEYVEPSPEPDSLSSEDEITRPGNVAVWQLRRKIAPKKSLWDNWRYFNHKTNFATGYYVIKKKSFFKKRKIRVPKFNLKVLRQGHEQRKTYFYLKQIYFRSKKRKNFKRLVTALASFISSEILPKRKSKFLRNKNRKYLNLTESTIKDTLVSFLK